MGIRCGYSVVKKKQAVITKELFGLQLLGLHDYMGQCTATIGILDAFWRSKGVISKEAFRQFCGPRVPLFKANRIYTTDESLEAELDLYQYGENTINQPKFQITILDGEKVLYEGETVEKHFLWPLGQVKAPAKLTVKLKAADCENSWQIFVYPTGDELKRQIEDLTQKLKEGSERVYVCQEIDQEVRACIENGGKVLLMPKAEHLACPVESSFLPVFWSPAYFKTQRACGMICDEKHPIFKGFPTDGFSNYQWKQPLEHAVCSDISKLPRRFKLILEPIPNFFDNTLRSPLFEMQVGRAKVLFCGFDLSLPNITIQALKKSILAYVVSEAFVPQQSLREEQLVKLFR